jgi:hypothetical protein
VRDQQDSFSKLILDVISDRTKMKFVVCLTGRCCDFIANNALHGYLHLSDAFGLVMHYCPVFDFSSTV